jgi:hypothetical protein
MSLLATEFAKQEDVDLKSLVEDQVKPFSSTPSWASNKTDVKLLSAVRGRPFLRHHLPDLQHSKREGEQVP